MILVIHVKQTKRMTITLARTSEHSHCRIGRMFSILANA